MTDFWSKDLQAAKAAEQSGPAGSKQSKAASEAVISAADAVYASREAKAKAEKAEADAAAAQAGVPEAQQKGAMKLTPGQQKVDENFAPAYNEWVSSGGYADTLRQLRELDAVLTDLKSGKQLSGAVVGRLPIFVQQILYGDDPQNTKASVNRLTVSSLRQILGSQFTKEEGERIQQMSYDPNVSEQSNIGKIQSSVRELLARAKAKEASANYFGKYGTLAGYTGPMANKPGEWDETLLDKADKAFETLYGAEKAESPYETIEKLKPVTEKRAGPSETYVTAEAKRMAAEMDKAWREGASVEEMIAKYPGVDKEALARAEEYRSLEEPVYAKFLPYESERPSSIIGQAAEIPFVGEGMAALVSATPGGSIEQIARLTGGDPEQTAFALDFLKGKYPISSSLGEFGGEFGRSVLGAKALTSLGMSALPATLATETGFSALEGGLEARPGESAAGTLIGGGRGAFMGALPFGFSRAFSPKTPEAVLAMRERGVPLTVGQTLGIPDLEANAAKVLPLGGDITLAAQRRAFGDLPRAYLDEAGSYIKAPALAKELKPTERFGQTQKAFDEAYKKAKANLTVARDPEFDAAVAELRGRLRNGVDFDPANAKRLEKLLDDVVIRRLSGKPSGDTYKDLDSLLGKRRAAFGKAQNDEMASGVSDMQKILRDNATRNSDPAAVKALDDVDTGYSYLIRAEEAAKSATTPAGEFYPSALLKATQKGDLSARGRAFARGEARGQEFAEQAAEALGKGATDVAPLERTAGLFVGPTLLSPVNAAMGIANAPGVRPALNTLIAGRRPEFLKGTGDLIAQYPALFSGAIGGADEVSLMLQNMPTDVNALLEQYGYAPQTAEQGVPIVGPELSDMQRKYAEQVAAQAGVPAVEEAPVPEEGDVLMDDRPTEMREDGRRYFVGTDELADVDTDPLAERSNPARGFAMGGLAHSLGAEVPQITVPMRAPMPAPEIVVPMRKYRGGRIQPYKKGGKATIADMARHYGAKGKK